MSTAENTCDVCMRVIPVGHLFLSVGTYRYCAACAASMNKPLTEARVREIVRDELQLAGILNR